jgi:hypothetical protein
VAIADDVVGCATPHGPASSRHNNTKVWVP